VFYVNIGGGEPTIRPDFWELVDYATAHHVGVKFSTNGVRITPQVASTLWSGMWLVKSPNHTEGTPAMPAGTSVVTSESSAPMASEIRALVAAAVAGVVIQP
jgi:hypothetical protein